MEWGKQKETEITALNNKTIKMIYYNQKTVSTENKLHERRICFGASLLVLSKGS